jgi:hypothetical protein
MTMEKPEKRNPAQHQPSKERQLIPSGYQHLTAGIIILLSLVLFFSPIIFENKTFLSNDAVGSLSWGPVLKDARAEGIIPLWNPYIFCGMPAYANLTFSVDYSFYDISAQVVALSSRLLQYLLGNHPLGYVLFYYLVLGLGMYALTFSKVQSKLIALLAGLGTVYSTYIIIWIMVSHITKIKTICWLPWIILLIEKLRVNIDWKYVLLLILMFHFLYVPFHVQMIFYVLLMLGLYYLVFFFNVVRKKEEWRIFLRSAATVSAAAILAVALNADRILTLYDYSKSSIRGAASILQESQPEEQPKEIGLDYSYATNWSFAPGEMTTFVLPSWYGFGAHQYQPGTAADPVTANTYWGPQPFVDGPQYMGIVILCCAVLGFVRNRKDPFVIFLAATTVIALFIAFGKEFPLLYSPMFEYFPMFNRFRVPSMILVLVQISIPLLAAFGISSLSQPGAGFQPDGQRKLQYVMYGIGALLVFSLVARGAVEVIHGSFFPIDDVGPKLAQALKTDQPTVVAEFYRLASKSVATDFSVALGLLLILFGGVWLVVKGKLRFSVLLVVLLVVSLGDLWRVDINPMEPVSRRYQESVFATPDYVHFLRRDTSLYRTLTFMDGRPPKDNILAHWKIENVYGYHPAKLRSYQDVIDAATLGNPLLLQLMNVKYIISNTVNTMTSRDTLLPVFDGPDGKIARFQISLPRSFFVRCWEVASGRDILKKIADLSFDPVDVAYVMEDPGIRVDPPQQGAKAEYIRYGLQDFALNVTATGNNLLFLSEVYYPNGWKAFMDGEEIPIYQLDYLFRGVVVPAGTHRLEMRFDPDSFRRGKNISLVSNFLLLGGGLALAAFGTWRKRRSTPDRTQT